MQDQLAALAELFPKKCLKYLQEKISRDTCSFEEKVAKILDEDDDKDSGVGSDGEISVRKDEPRPSTSKDISHIVEKNYTTLVSLFPWVSPAFLQV